MKAVVVFESMYGNTRAVANAVADGIAAGGDADVTVVAADDASTDLTGQADLLVVGGPTHMHGMSRPKTRRAAKDAAKPGSGLTVDPAADGPGIRDWLGRLTHTDGLAAAFDTRLAWPAVFAGRAASGIDRGLRRSGLTPISRPHSFLVTKDSELRPGETAKAREWGAELSRLAARRDRPAKPA